MKNKTVFKPRSVGPSEWWLITHGKKLAQPRQSLKDELDLCCALPRQHDGLMSLCEATFVRDLEPSTLERQELVRKRIIYERSLDAVDLRAVIACGRIRREGDALQIDRPRH